MKKALLILVLHCFAQHNYSQTIKVANKTTLYPIGHVSILDNQLQIKTSTNIDGKADIANFKMSDSISIQDIGYHTQKLSYKQLEEMNFTVYLTENNYSLNEVVISANRFEQKITNIPQKITAINSRELEFTNPQTSAQIVQNSGYAFVQMSQMGGGSPTLRGFEANKILLTVDGVRMNNAIYRGGHLQNIITIDNSMLERVEMLYGTGTAAYGSDALGGVISFYTKKPILADSISTQKIITNAFTRFSSANSEKTGHVDFNIGSKKLASLTSITYSDFGDLRQGSNRHPDYPEWGKRNFYVQRINGKDSMVANPDPNIQTQTAYKQYSILEKILYQQSNSISHLVNIQYSTSSDIPRYDRLTETGKNGVLKSAQWYYGPQAKLFASYNLNLKASKGAYNQANIIVGYQNIEESRHNRNFNSSKLNHRIEKIDVVTMNIDFDKNLSSNQLRYGIEGNYNKVNSTASLENIMTGSLQPLDTRYPDGGSTMTSLSAYITNSWQINKAIILNGGIRYSNTQLNSEFIDTTFFHFPFDEITQKSQAVNGNLGLVIHPGSNWELKALVSTGFRTPNVDDLSKVFESAAGKLIVPNPELKPENTYNAEIGISKNINNLVNIECDAYYTIYNNVITTHKGKYNSLDSIVYQGQWSEISTQVNANQAYIYGVSGAIDINITSQLSLNSTLTYTYGRIKTDSVDYPLDHIPPVFGKTALNLHIKRFRGEFFMLYNGWKRIANYNMLGEDNQIYATPDGTPMWYTANIKTAYSFNKHINLQLAVENIFDKNYRMFASGISAPGRNYTVTLRGRF